MITRELLWGPASLSLLLRSTKRAVQVWYFRLLRRWSRTRCERKVRACVSQSSLIYCRGERSFRDFERSRWRRATWLHCERRDLESNRPTLLEIVGEEGVIALSGYLVNFGEQSRGCCLVSPTLGSRHTGQRSADVNEAIVELVWHPIVLAPSAQSTRWPWRSLTWDLLLDTAQLMRQRSYWSVTQAAMVVEKVRERAPFVFESCGGAGRRMRSAPCSLQSKFALGMVVWVCTSSRVMAGARLDGCHRLCRLVWVGRFELKSQR